MDGLAHLVSGELVRRPAAAKRAVRAGKAPGAPAAPVAAGAGKGSGRPAPVKDAVLRAVEETPRTSAEVIDRVFDFLRGTGNASTRPSVSQTISDCRRQGLIEQREDENRLSKWYLTTRAGERMVAA